MSYIALRDFDKFKKGDSIPAEFVQDRLIRGKKIGLANGSELVQIKEELITEVIEEVEEVQEKEEILLEDSSDVSVEVKEELEVLPEETKVSKKSKK